MKETEKHITTDLILVQSRLERNSSPSTFARWKGKHDSPVYDSSQWFPRI